MCEVKKVPEDAPRCEKCNKPIRNALKGIISEEETICGKCFELEYCLTDDEAPDEFIEDLKKEQKARIKKYSK